jgi:hypothetical protein
MPAGTVIKGHKHNFDHVTYCVRGRLRIEAVLPGGDRVTREIGSDDLYPYVLIRAGVEHTLTALLDGTTYHCVYAHRTAQGDVVQAYTGWPDAYR